jgi:hypothetical protein
MQERRLPLAGCPSITVRSEWLVIGRITGLQDWRCVPPIMAEAILKRLSKDQSREPQTVDLRADRCVVNGVIKPGCSYFCRERGVTAC